MPGEIFSWWKDSSIVVRPQLGIAVYPNDTGDIVVRQECEKYEDQDSAIVVPREHARIVALAILAAANLSRSSLPDEPQEIDIVRTKDRTGAERQRRYREKRNASDSVTSRDGVTAETQDLANGRGDILGQKA